MAKKPPIRGTDPVPPSERVEDSTPDTANERVQNKSIRHQIGVRRFTAGEVKTAQTILTRAERELTRKLERRLEGLAGRPPDFTSQRFRAMRDDIRELRREMMLDLRREVRGQLVGLAKVEQNNEKRIFETSIPVQLDYAVASTATLASAIRTKPFAGGTNSARNLQQWFESLARADQARIMEAIQLGMVQQESVQQIVRRIRGTSAAAFQNGTLAQTRRNMEAVVRTAINHVTNTAREEFWKANEDIIGVLRWTAVLDGRTSLICAGRDGKLTTLSGDNSNIPPEKRLVPSTARPPAHPNCRSVMIAILDSDGVEQTMPERPFVVDTRTGRRRQVDFRDITREEVGRDKWKAMSASQRNAAVKKTRVAWADKNIGTLPLEVDYDTFLRRQSAGFQDEVLGPTRGKAFREGMKVDRFTDRVGNELTLDELAADNPEFF